MELVPAVTAWLSSKQRLLKRNVQDAVSNPADFVDKQLTNFNEDMKPEQVFDLEVWKRELASQGKGLVEGEAATAVLGKAFGPAGMAAAQAASVLTPMLVGAFRPVGSKLLPSTLQIIKSDMGEFSLAEGSLAESIQKKASGKVLQKYGTEEFPLDPYLAHMRGTRLESPEAFKKQLNPRELSLQDMRAGAQHYSERKPILDRLVADGKRDPAYRSEVLRRLEGDLRAYRFALSEKAPIFRVEPYAGAADIQEGAYNLSQVLENSPYSPDQLSKKSLEQLVSIGKKTEAAQLKEASVIKDFTVKRSAQLNQEQGLPKGFVELKTRQDLGAETEFMNNCVGAGGAHPQTGKFLPKWHPITGEQITKGFAEDSGDKYWKRLQSGNERIFSYRPEGLPVATIRMDTRTGEVIEALGMGNRPIPSDISNHIKSFVTQKRAEFLGFPLAAKYKQITLEDPFAHNVPRAIGQLIRPRGEGAVQVAAWEAEQAALRAARELNPPPAQIELGDF
jgi:hypothetical protein